MGWTVKINRKIQKQIEKLPPSPRRRLNFLVAEIKKYGPVRDGWANYGRIRGQKDCYHCHLKKGNPTYVAVWKAIENENKIVEIKYAGTHERVDYSRVC
ncbi:MAG: cytotoxic translational repressor of toxin-antitoxin stability system [Deltaproteobacteria bacterium]|nr:cytotoxic translational repressor of toxin-antitoxin stability system [Deltaproteobacteria bacterium]